MSRRALAVFIREEIDPAMVVGWLNGVCVDHGLRCSMYDEAPKGSGAQSLGISGEAVSEQDTGDAESHSGSAASSTLKLKWTVGRHKSLGNVLLLTFELGSSKRLSKAVTDLGKAALCTGKAAGSVVLGTIALATFTVVGILFESGEALLIGGAGFVGGLECVLSLSLTPSGQTAKPSHGRGLSHQRNASAPDSAQFCCGV